ncbi:MAG: epoxyqueuosine reductase QueH [Thomasclavelia sp.]|nr:epoxyqueuosine reductase QueH [Thomasclavelia sp.]
MKINYNIKFEEELELIGNSKPSLLLHVCCGPCSSNILKEIANIFDITVFYSNSNIYPIDEYKRRYEELLDFIERFNNDYNHNIKIIEKKYEPENYLNQLKEYKDEKEGGKRCYKCYLMRETDTYNYALDNNFDYWTTVLSVSPHKNSQWINEIGLSFDQSKTKFLCSDFKKNNGYKKSVEMASRYNLYRQTYCGCLYSYEDMLKRPNNK